MNSNKQNLINKILYRSKYRGTKEMDNFIYSFVKSIIYQLSILELNQLNKLINLSDEKIIQLYNDKNIDNRFDDKIVNMFKNYKNKI